MLALKKPILVLSLGLGFAMLLVFHGCYVGVRLKERWGFDSASSYFGARLSMSCFLISFMSCRGGLKSFVHFIVVGLRFAPSWLI